MSRPQRAKDPIDAAALACFARKGVAATSITDIAREAGVSSAAIYHFYASKDALVTALFETHYRALGRALTEAADGAPTAAQRLAAMVRAACVEHDAAPDLFRFLLLVQHDTLPRLAHDPESPVEVVRATLENAVANGEIPQQDPDLATALVFGIVLQPATFIAYGRLEGTMAGLAPRLQAACWRALRDD